MNRRKLLLNERVEVRQFEEGLRGSWHPGVVVGVAKLSRSVEYDELLCETGESKLIESIPVTKAIEGLHCRRRNIPSAYRGHIRPPPPASDTCGKLSFGVCVDALFEDAWWEGIVFDFHNDANERLVFFPDESDEKIFNVSQLRISRDWDELLGMWCDRGVWILVQLAVDLIGDVSLCSYIKEVWSYLRLNYGFNKIISEWTYGARNVWSKYFRDAVCETAAESSKRVLANQILSHGNKTRVSKYDKVISASLKARNCGALNIAKSSKKTQEKNSSHDCIQNKPLNSKPRSKKQPAKNTTNNTSFQVDNLCGGKQLIDNLCGGKQLIDNLCGGKQLIDGDSSIILNDTVKRKFDRTLENFYDCDKGANSISLSTQNKHSGEGESNRDKTKFLKVGEGDGNQCLVDCLEQEKIAHVKKSQSVRGRGNLTKSRRITRSLANGFLECNHKLRKRKFSLVIVRKRRKCSSMKKRVSKRFQQANSKSMPPSNVKDKVLGAKPAKNDLSFDQAYPDLPFKSYGKNVSPKGMVFHPRKSKRKRAYYGTGDTICSFCHYGGDLTLCNECPSSYHLSCLDLKDVPHGNWFCPSCCCQLCGKVDISLVTNACLQCTRAYHVHCPSEAGCLLPMDYPSENFCSKACYELCLQLHQLLGISNPTSVDGLTWTLTRSSKDVYSFPGIPRNNTCIKISHVLRVMHECFQPAKDPHTKRDLVRDLVYNAGSRIRRLNFLGFYAVVLHRGDEIVSVATLRIHGLKAAEMPLIATPFQYRQQGMCRLLVHELLKLLTKFGVERLVLPAIAELRKTWETSFGFLEMPHSVRLQLSGYPFMGFQGTIMLQKVLSSSRITKETDDSAGTSQDLKENSCSISLVNNYGLKDERRFCGLFYERKEKSKIIGKENMVNNCNRNMQTYVQVYKRRRILGRRVE